VCDDAACRATGGEAVLRALAEREDVVASPCLCQCDFGSAAFIKRAGEDDFVIAPATAAEVTSALAGSQPGTSTPVAPRSALRILSRVGVVDPSSLDSYRAHGGYEALAKTVDRGGEWVLDQVTASNLRGRGGAAFPTGVKWKGAIDSEDPETYLICNADESEPGTFKDRVVMEGDPFSVIEAMTIAGLTIGARQGFIYIRGEYPAAAAALRSAIEQARAEGLLGPDILGSGLAFDIEPRHGQGAYICGEETALFNSIEGFRGEPRQKPPFPTTAGLFSKPTVVNNVETLVNVLDIVNRGGEAFARTGTPDSTGTRLFCVSGAIDEPGVYEVEFGTTLGSILEMAGGAPEDLQAILLGGAAGSFVGADLLDLPLTFEDSRAAGVALGSGVIVVYDASVDMRQVTRRIARFFRDESCGQCVPCRVGTVRIEEALARALVGDGALETDLIDDIDRAMKDASICGLGHTAATAIHSAISMGLI
ncbi:MAG TPA: NADH-ubiquinone oxidoreductase-F iron-sulfur binding region domain-containing protein, partial [Candidatus Sulfomarinibacteraceae bacterium]|nr:NADH-ubiquinone oxidoreductase-F iron-sulfur binding region domain-containing protein [Candidatus Sulfomarinibacteraceae bacterium]